MLFFNNLSNYGCFTGEDTPEAPQTTIVDVVLLMECVCMGVLRESLLDAVISRISFYVW